MGNVRIVTDSTADIPAELREKLGITMVPLKVLFGEETYVDAVTITAEQFYKKLKSAQNLPTTSQPSPLEFSEVYERLLQEDPDSPIISIHLAACLSGTYQSATIAQSMLEQEADITVVDSRSASYGIGTLVVRAAEMALAGSDKDSILAEVQRLRSDIAIYFLVDSLDHLHKGGRIGRASAMIGSILNIKPILSLDSEGAVHAVDKVRGTKKAMARIADMLKEGYGSDPVSLTIFKSDDETISHELGDRVKADLNVKHIGYSEIGPVIGTHTGPGTAAVLIHRV